MSLASPGTSRTSRRAIVLLGALVLLGGCGGGGGGGGGGGESTTQAPKPSPEAQVRATWRGAASAAASGNGTAFCAQVSPAGKAKLQAQTSLPCVDSVRLLASQLTPADRAAVIGAVVTHVSVTGDTAVIRYETTPKLARFGFTGRTELTRSGDRWLLQGI